MQTKLPAVIILFISLSCEQLAKQKTLERDNLYFQAIISPAFDEYAEVTILKIANKHKIQFLLRNAYGIDKPSDTFYFKTADLNTHQFQKIDNELFKRIPNGHSIQNNGIRDGIGFGFTIIKEGDTSNLVFANPQKGIDSAAFEIISVSIENFQSILSDTIINDYLYDIETYSDNSMKESSLKGKRTIDKLRRIKYSR